MDTQVRALSPPPPPADGDLFVSNFPVDHLALDPPLDDAEAQDRFNDPELAGDGSHSITDNDTVSSGAASYCHDVLDKIVRQVEYYFSDENLPNDLFLSKQVRKDKEGYVPIKLISSFKRMKKLTKDLSLIEAALKTSSLVVVSTDGKRVKRLHPLPAAEVRDEKPRTVLVENLPEDYSEDNIRRIFAVAGPVVGITIRDPHSAEQLATLKKEDLSISNKLHALVEYDSVEAAENAVLTLNNEKNWRIGMRVQILLKRMEKYGLVQKPRKNFTSEKNNGAEALEMPLLNQDALDKEEGNGSRDKGGRKRYKGRGRASNHHQPTNGHVYSIGASGSSAEGGTTNKPIAGPKMPDGTRGFAMGRGRPITT